MFAVEWRSTGEDLCSAAVRLELGGTIYLSVESLQSTGWDWLVWDANRRMTPRHGLAATESVAKRQAELSMQEVSAVLINLAGHPGEMRQRIQ